MKLKGLKLSNFAKFDAFEISFNDKITHLVGVNGSGKTTIGLTAIWAAIKGVAEKGKEGQLIGERFRFIGGSKASADVELTIIDEERNNAEIKVNNHITKASNEITFKAPKDYPISHEWINELLSVAFLSAKNFTQHSSKEQSLLLGIKTDEFDAAIKVLKEEYTLINRDIRGFGEITPVEHAERVDADKLVEKKNKIREALNKKYLENKSENQKLREIWNKQCELQRKHIQEFNDLQATYTQEFNAATDALAILTNLGYNGSKGNEVEAFVLSLGKKIQHQKEYKPLPEPSYISEIPDDNELKEIDQQIANAAAVNEAAYKHEQYLVRKKQKEEKEKQLEENKSRQVKAESDRLKYIKSFNFGFEGLTVDDDGGLLLNGRPIKDSYFSKGELELIVAKLYTSLHPKLKVRFIDDFELLDQDNQAKIVEQLLADGFQIITAEVGNTAVKDNTVLLRECKQVKSYDSKKEKLI